MPTKQQLIDQRANIWEQMKEVMDVAEREGRELTAEEAAKYDRLETDLDAKGAQVARLDRHESHDESLNKVDRPEGRPGAAPDQSASDEYSRVFDSFLRHGPLDMDGEDRRLLTAHHDSSLPRNAGGVGTGGAGGYTVPAEFRDRIVETSKWYGPMLAEAEVIITETGAQLPWATNDDTGNVGAILGENTQVTEQDFAFGTANLDAYMYTSRLVRESLQLLQDSAFVTDAWIARKLGERLGRITNAHFTTGTGTNQPDGIVTGATVGVTGTGSFASTGGVSYENLVDIVESLDPAYGNAAGGSGEAAGLKWMVHQSARKAFRKMKDGQNRPLWEPSLQAGAADSLLGYEVAINNDMPALAAGSKSVLFGNIRQAYVIRIVRDVTLLRLTERYADFLQVGFLAFQRADGTLQDGNAVRVFQTTATA